MPFGELLRDLLGVEREGRWRHSGLTGIDYLEMKIESKPDATGAVMLALAGKLHANSLGEVRRAIDRARRQRFRHVALDLSEITLADRASIDFLQQQSREEIELLNCPAYLAPWIEREP